MVRFSNSSLGNGSYSRGLAVAPSGVNLVASALRGRKVVILGLARQGSALARFLAAAGARVVISDAAPAQKLRGEVEALGALSVDLALGGHPSELLDDCALLCLSGGVPPQIPIVQEAMRRGIPLSNDSLLTFQAVAHLGLGPLIAVTGSSGKTTTTTLVGRILDATGRQSHVGGNIGLPLLDRLGNIRRGEPIVMELSSFQLELFDAALAWGTLTGIGPQVATLTNLTPNHLDRHPSMADYVAAKLNLLHCMDAGSTLVVNADDSVSARLLPPMQRYKHKKLPVDWRLDDMLAEARAKLVERGVNLVPVSRVIALEEGAWLAGDTLFCAGEAVMTRDEAHLRGEHNISNILTAFALAHAAGAHAEAMRDATSTFAGVAHRLEVVSERNGVTWINDSIATSPERAVAGIRSFDPTRQTLILLAGGKDKKLPWDSFANEAVARVSFLIGFGHSGSMIVEAVQERARFSQQKAPNCAVVQRLDEAVVLAKSIAGPNSVVLLSPGGTSYDAYKDFEERGEHFRQLVHTHVDRSAGVAPGDPVGLGTGMDAATEDKSE